MLPSGAGQAVLRRTTSELGGLQRLPALLPVPWSPTRQVSHHVSMNTEAPAVLLPVPRSPPLQDADESAAKQKLKDSAAAHLKKFYEVGCTRSSGMVHLSVQQRDDCKDRPCVWAATRLATA